MAHLLSRLPRLMSASLAATHPGPLIIRILDPSHLLTCPAQTFQASSFDRVAPSRPSTPRRFATPSAASDQACQLIRLVRGIKPFP